MSEAGGVKGTGAGEGQQATRVMMIGAHPDDCDFRAGGCAALWQRAGIEVMFVSATNGDAGHHTEGGGALAKRRAAEAKAAGEVIGITYITLDIHDGEMVPSLENRKTLIRVIRRFHPHLVITHRPWDYHADHRYTGQLVQDASFLITVPNICPDVPPQLELPVMLYSEDGFQKPLPFKPDLIVDIDPVIELKGDMLHCHESQVYEWLMWPSHLDEVPKTAEERRAWTRGRVRGRSHHTAERFRELLTATYGAEHGGRVECAEAFEVCEYGAALTPERRQRLFPFVPMAG